MTEAVTISLKVCAMSAVITDKSVDLLQLMKFHEHFAAAYINSHFRSTALWLESFFSYPSIHLICALMIRFWKKLLIVQQPFWPNDYVSTYIFISLLRNLCINDTGTIYSTTPNLVAGCQAVRTLNMGQNFDGFVSKSLTKLQECILISQIQTSYWFCLSDIQCHGQCTCM